MYTVLIQNKKTMDVFRRYHPLFLEGLKSNLGVVRWFETGTTIDTALPELKGLTNDKESWRAIIVRVEDEGRMSYFRSAADNPYDFAIEDDSCDEESEAVSGEECSDAEGQDVKDPEAGKGETENAENPGGEADSEAQEKKSAVKRKKSITESDVPLVRLTQLLGGIPSPLVEYEQGSIIENGIERIVYKPLKDEELTRQYNELIHKLEYDGKRPTEIILFTFRNIYKDKDEVISESAVNSPFEIKSSDFWRKNGYPSLCRFITYDYCSEGRIKKDEDLFRFWLCVSILANNKIDPSSFQAYRLYKINVKINSGKLLDNLQDKELILADLRNCIDQDIKLEIEKKQSKVGKIPEFVASIPIEPNFPNSHEYSVSEKEFPLTPKSEQIERKKWLKLSDEAEAGLAGFIKSTERSLEYSSEMVRIASEIDEDDVISLDRLQQEELEDKLFGQYNAILEMRDKLPYAKMAKSEKLKEAAEKVNKSIFSRLELPVFLESAMIVVLLAIISFLPVFFVYKFLNLGKIPGGLYYGGIAIVAFLIILLAILWILRNRFIKLIRAYNKEIEDNISAVSVDVNLFTQFTQSLATFTQGRRYERNAVKSQYILTNSLTNLQKHLKASSYMMNRLQDWADAFYLGELSRELHYSDTLYATDVSPEENEIYSLTAEKPVSIPLNESGVMLICPFDFVEKIELTREELYDR